MWLLAGVVNLYFTSLASAAAGCFASLGTRFFFKSAGVLRISKQERKEQIMNHTPKTIGRWTQALLCAGVILTAGHARAANPPNVNSAVVNSSTNQITITGANLLPATGSPVVKLDSIQLSLVTYNNTSILAGMPSGLGAGTYKLLVTVGASSATFDVAVGAVGPQGPIGPQGPAGPAGPPLSLPYSATASVSGPAFTVQNTAGGGLMGQGSNGWAGVSGYASDSTTSGVFASGSNSSSASGQGGVGVNSFGGTAGVGGSGGTAIVALAGEGDVYGYFASTADAGIVAFGGSILNGCQVCQAGAGGIFEGGGGSPNSGAVSGGDGIDAYAGTSTGVAIYAEHGGNPTVGLFAGNVQVNGNLSKAGGSFQIDHPLDPANKYLYHSFVESPDMTDMYHGNVVTDGGGHVMVALPGWFEALNRDFRYQLTTIGQPAHAWIAAEIVNNQFLIATDRPNVKVSWQVIGIRQDAWANAHRIPVEADKDQADQGHYLHPELFGHERDLSIPELHHPRPPQRDQLQR
jgi:hypothetical protein